MAYLTDRETGEPITGHLVIATRTERQTYPAQTRNRSFRQPEVAEFEIPELDAELFT